MQSLSTPLNRLHEDAAWFARAHELRLLVVRTSSDLRKTALRLLAQLEFHADNFSPWVVLENARTPEDDGWQARANWLAQDWERRREPMAKEGIVLPPVEARAGIPTAQSAAKGFFAKHVAAPPNARVSPFLLTTADALQALREPLRGLVAVLAPTIVDDAKAFEEEIEVLLKTPALDRCRFILVLDAEAAPPQHLLGTLGDSAFECDCQADPADLDRDIEAILASSEPGSAAASGGAGPRGVVPPRRVDDPPELPKEERDAALREAGIDPRYIDEAPRLRNLVLGAALAMKQGRGPDAVRQQREARDLADQLQMHQIKVICQIALASYLSGLDHAEEAIRELEDAIRSAHEHGLGVQESQAYLALGLLHALGKRLPEAVRAYVQAARSAEAADMPLIAIESWRLAGQLAAQEKATPQAMDAFKEAIRIASGTDPAVAKVSSAPEAARMLAVLCRKRGLNPQAESLDAQAQAMERGETVKVNESEAGA